MIGNLVKKFVGSRNDRLVKQYQKALLDCNQLADQMAALSDDQLRAKTDELRARALDGAELDELLPCLLYTSPSPRDATLSRMPSSA